MGCWLAVGSFIIGLFIWLTGLQPKPDTSPAFLKSLAPVALFHTLGHVTACIAFGAMAVSFAHIVKSAEPVPPPPPPTPPPHAMIACSRYRSIIRARLRISLQQLEWRSKNGCRFFLCC